MTDIKHTLDRDSKVRIELPGENGDGSYRVVIGDTDISPMICSVPVLVTGDDHREDVLFVGIGLGHSSNIKHEDIEHVIAEWEKRRG